MSTGKWTTRFVYNWVLHEGFFLVLAKQPQINLHELLMTKFSSAYMHHLRCGLLNSLGPSDAIWWHRTGPTLAQVMADCLMTQSHYLIQCWHQQWSSLAFPWGQFHWKCSIYESSKYILQNYTFKITAISLRGQWVKLKHFLPSSTDISTFSTGMIILRSTESDSYLTGITETLAFFSLHNPPPQKKKKKKKKKINRGRQLSHPIQAYMICGLVV